MKATTTDTGETEMTEIEMTAEMSKLNPSQRRALRSELCGRGAAALISVDEAISKVTVEFKHSNGKRFAHWLMLGPRGRVVYHDVSRIA